MSDLVLLELQEAIYSLLSGDSTLGAMISGVYDRVPESTSYPYVNIGDADSREWSTATSTGADTLMNVHIYSREGGRKESLQIAKRIHTLLHEVSVSITGHICVSCRHVASAVELLGDGLSYHGRMQFRLLTEKE